MTPLAQLVAEIDFTGNPTATYADTIRSGPPVSYWRMASAASLVDELAANNGTLVGSPSLVTGALPLDSNQALSFNGTSQRAYVASSAGLGPPSFSVQLWLKVASLPGSTKTIAAKPGSWKLVLHASGKLEFVVKNDTSLGSAIANTVLSTGVWCHVVGVFDAAAQKINLYLEGFLEQSTSWLYGSEVGSNPVEFASAGATTAPTYQSSATAGSATPPEDAICAKPAGTASGDLLIAHINTGEPVNVTPPAGWDLVANDATTQNRTRLFTRIAGGSEPASYTFTLSDAGAAGWSMAISRFTGVDPSVPLANPVYGGATAVGTTHSAGTHTPNRDNVLAAAFFSSQSNGTWTPSEGTERYDYTHGGNRSIALVTAPQGETPINITGTCSGSAVGTAHVVFINGTGVAYTAVSLDEASFWNVALSADQVRDHYEARLSGLGAWVDVSDDCRSVSTRLGRQYELSRMEAGTGAVTMKNQLRDYDPQNQSSPYWPNVIPNRKMRLRALVSGSYYPLLQALIERWPAGGVNVPSYDEVQLTLADGFKPLSLAGVSQILPDGLAGAQIETQLDRAAWPSADRAIDPGLFVMVGETQAGTVFAKDAISELADSELGIFFISPAGLATFHDREHRWTNSRSLVSQATFSDQGGDVIPYTGLSPSDDDDNTINHWQVTTKNGTLREARDVVAARQHFPRSQWRSTRLDHPDDAATQATALLQQTAKPALRFDSLTVTPQTLTQWQTVLALQISDRVTVVRRPVPGVTGSTITKECFVEGIAWTITPSVWRVKFQLSPVATASYFDTVMREQPVSYWRMATTT